MHSGCVPSNEDDYVAQFIYAYYLCLSLWLMVFFGFIVIELIKKFPMTSERQWVLKTVHNNQFYWVFALCPSPGILKKIKNTVFRIPDLFPSSGKGKAPTLLGPLERVKIGHCITHLSIVTDI
jgi:hypothetical protein